MIDNDRHALYIGWVLGLAMRHGLPFQPEVDDEGNYTDRLVLNLTATQQIALVVPPPPEEWSMADER